MSDHDEIAAIVRDVSPSVKLDPSVYDKPLFDVGLDSLDHATILLQIEEMFGIKIPDSDAGALVSVADMAAYVAKARAG